MNEDPAKRKERWMDNQLEKLKLENYENDKQS